MRKPLLWRGVGLGVKQTLVVLFSCLAAVLVGQVLSWAKHPPESFTISGQPERPPFYWREGEECLGAGRELAELALSSVGLNAVFQCNETWERALFDAKQGKLDAVVGSIPTEGRSRFLAFVEPFLTETAISVWVWKERSFAYNGWSDLIGKRGVLVGGESTGEAFEVFAKKKLDLNYVSSPLEAMKKLSFGRVQFFLFSRYGGVLLVKKFGYEERIVLTGPPVSVEKVHFAVSKRSRLAEYLPHLETAMFKLRAEGEFERLLKKYEALYLERP
jgi:polar amino acid transport system substrate-binding protein